MCKPFKAITRSVGIRDPLSSAPPPPAPGAPGSQYQAPAPVPVDNSAASRSAVDNAFGGFSPSFYGNRTNAYVNNYVPQVARQYSKANDSLYTGLVAKGLDNSTVGKKYMSDLSNEDTNQLNRIKQNAEGDTSAYRSRVESAKSGLYGEATPGSDPGTVAAHAAAQAGALAGEHPIYSAIGDLFSSLIAPVTNRAVSGAPTSFVPGKTSVFGLPSGGAGFNLATSGGSNQSDKSRVING